MTAIDLHHLFPKKTTPSLQRGERSSRTRQPDDSPTSAHPTQPALPAIVAQKIQMIYEIGGQRYPALQNVNLTVQSGAVHLLMGPSGSGKTTLLSILAGLLTPSEGSITLLGQEITELNQARLADFRL